MGVVGKVETREIDSDIEVEHEDVARNVDKEETRET